jgi:hypothetical protein
MNRAIVFVVAIAAVLGIGVLAFLMFDDSSGKSSAIDVGAGPAKTGRAPVGDVDARPITTLDTAKPPAPKISTTSLAESGGMLADAGVMGVVQNEAGTRIDGAVCELFEDGSMLKDRSQEGESRAKQSTTVEGLFLFDRNVLSLAERYLLKVSHPMYTTERKAVDVRRDAGVITIVMKQGTAISGVVRTVAGAGLANATVTVYDLAQNALDPNGSVETFATADNTGAYTVMHVSPGMKRVTASAQGFASSSRQGMNVEAGRPQVNVDFTLNEGGGISGQVMSSEGTPIAGGYVTARPVRVGPRPDAEATAQAVHEMQARREGDVKRREHAMKVEEAGADSGVEDGADPERVREMKDLILQKEAQMKKEREALKDSPAAKRAAAHQPPSALTTLSVRTQADGTFTITGTEIGSYVVSVNSPGFMPPAQQSVETPAQGILFTLQPNARILGRVLDDVTGRPIPMFSVGLTTNPDEVLVPAYSKKSFGPPKSADGNFEYVDVRPGKFWLVADAAGYAGGRSAEIVIQQGERREGVEIRLVRGATILGRVVDAKGGGVPNAVVLPEPASMTANAANPFIGVLTQNMRRDIREATTDSDGRFTLPNMLSGSYTLSVKHPAYGPQTTPVFTVGTAGETTHPDIVVSKGAIIRGRVKLADGQPDPKAMVTVTPVGGTPNFSAHRNAYTNSEGRFEVAGLAVGQYRVVVAQRNGTPDLSSLFRGLSQQGGQAPNIITVGEGEEKDVDL